MKIADRTRLRAGVLALASLLATAHPGQRLAQAQQAGTEIAQAQPRRTVISGVVYDSVRMSPLRDAVVQLASVARGGTIAETRSARTDSLGEFRLADVDVGTYLIGFQHIALDTMGLRAAVSRVDVRRDTPVRVPLAVPSPRSIVMARCGGTSLKDSIALLVGTVRDARTEAPIPRGYVSIKWSEMLIGKNAAMQRSTPSVDLFADDEGWYSACVPGATPILTRAAHETQMSGELELEIATLGMLRRDLYVGAAERRMAQTPDSTLTRGATKESESIVATGTGRVRGRVRGRYGRALEGARVSLWGAQGEARTNADGEFVLGQLPRGTHTLEARAIGYLPVQLAVDIVQDREPIVELALVTTTAELLDTVRVRASPALLAAATAGFERRRKAGMGWFLDDAAIDAIRPVRFSDILRGAPGVRMQSGANPDDAFEEQIQFGFSRGSPCVPAIYYDGARMAGGRVDLNQLIPAGVVRRIEVYQRGITPPAEFASNDRCGVLVIWTGGRARGPLNLKAPG